MKKKLNVYIFHYGPKPIPEFVHQLEKDSNINLILGPKKEDHKTLMNIPFYRNAENKKIYAFMSDYWRMWIIKKEGPGLYIDTSFLLHSIKSFDKFIDSLGSRNYFFLEKPDLVASCIFFVRDSSIAVKYLKYYDEYTNKKIRRIGTSPNILTKVLVGDHESKYENMMAVLGGHTGLEKIGNASWNKVAPRFWKERTAKKYWQDIKKLWIEND